MFSISELACASSSGIVLISTVGFGMEATLATQLHAHLAWATSRWAGAEPLTQTQARYTVETTT